MSKCDRCGNPSVYHSKLIVNGVSQSTNLCRDCAIKEGVFNNEPTSMFDDILSSFTNFLGLEKTEDVVCPVCKTSLREFKTTGKLGCPNCYEMFREEVSNIIKRVAPFEKHKQQEISAPKPKAKNLTKEEKILNLKQQMADAVKEERYEDAAKIKKQIAKLEAENE